MQAQKKQQATKRDFQEDKMNDSTFSMMDWLPFAVAFFLVFVLLIILRIKGKLMTEGEYDERQLVGRGKAYQYAFFSLIFYNVIYGYLDAVGVKWCLPSVGVMVGVLFGVTVFAVTAICRDAFIGIRDTHKRSIRILIAGALAQTVCFFSDLADGGVVKDGLLTTSFVSLCCAVCFSVIVIVFLIHSRKNRLPEEQE